MSYIETGPGIVVCMLIYIERIVSVLEQKYRKKSRSNAPFLLTSNNVHRLLLTAFLIAHKYCDEYRVSTKNFARIGGVEPKELIKLEIEFLRFIKYELYVSEETFAKYYNSAIAYGREVVTQSRA